MSKGFIDPSDNWRESHPVQCDSIQDAIVYLSYAEPGTTVIVRSILPSPPVLPDSINITVYQNDL